MQPNNASTTMLPRAIRRQMKLVDERIAARSAAGVAPAQPTVPAAAAPTATTETTDAPAGAAPVPSATPAQAPAVQLLPGESALTATEAERVNDPVYWRERFRLMQGINDKQRQDTAAALADRDRELADLRQRVKELEQSSGEPTKGKPDIATFFSQEQIERFGEDQCEAMAAAAIKAAREQAQQVLDAEVKPLKDRQQADDANKVKAAQAAFWKTLDELIAKIPEARNRTIWEINEEQPWLDFLNDVGDDGEQRQAALNRYQSKLNAQGVANLVKAYLHKQSPKPPVPPVAPGRGASAASDQQPAGSQTASGKGYPSPAEFADYTKRAATIRNPRDPRFVTDKERQDMEARLRLPRPGAG